MKTTRKRSFPPISTEDLSDDERDDLIESGWRTFTVPGVGEFIVPQRKAPPPTIGGRRATAVVDVSPLPRATYSYESKGPRRGERMDLMAWPYSTTTVQDFDGPFLPASAPAYLRNADNTPPESLSGVPGVTGYLWTDNGLHVYQAGKHPPLPGSDPDYERISKENRGWYGDRIRSYDEIEVRTLVTSDEAAATAWLQAGGKVRLVKDVVRSYGASRKRRGY